MDSLFSGLCDSNYALYERKISIMCDFTLTYCCVGWNLVGKIILWNTKKRNAAYFKFGACACMRMHGVCLPCEEFLSASEFRFIGFAFQFSVQVPVWCELFHNDSNKFRFKLDQFHPLFELTFQYSCGHVCFIFQKSHQITFYFATLKFLD